MARERGEAEMDGMPREWSRGPQWESPGARAEWEPVLRAAQAAWPRLEVLSVSEGVRDSALLHLTPEELVRATLDAAGQGLDVTPLAWAGDHFRAALHRPGLRNKWLVAWTGNDDRLIGELLGFPACCREHFARTWGAGRTDTVLPIARISRAGGTPLGGPPEANLLLRHVGVRLVPHLPCSPTCEPTVALGRRIAEAGRCGGEDVDAIYRLLELPATYSALHGVAIIDFGAFRILAGTDSTPAEARVTRAANPARALEGISGAHNPAPPGSTPGLAPATTWKDNGFSTREAMDAAHDVVLRAVGTASSALDLGAGDGALLSKIAAGRTAPRSAVSRLGPWVGIEVDARRAARGEARHPSVTLRKGTIQEEVSLLAQLYDVVLLMPGRLLEMSVEDAARMREALPRLGRRLVVYAYGDMLARHGGLAALCRAAGIRGTLLRYCEGPGVQAAEVQW